MRCLASVFAVVALALAASSAQAGATASLFADNPPNYFSGTNCKVFGSAVVHPSGPPTRGFVEAFLAVDGIIIKQWVSPDGEPVLQHFSLNATIDSTHFEPNEWVTVSFAARGDDGIWYYANPIDVQVINRAAVYGRFDLRG